MHHTASHLLRAFGARRFPGLLSLLALVLVIALCTPQRSSAAEVVDRIVAVVNGEIVTLGELDDAVDAILKGMDEPPPGHTMDSLRQMGRQRVLDTMINDILLRQEAERLGVEVDTTDVESAIRRFKEQNDLTEEEFRNQLALKNLTREEYAKNIAEQIVKQRLLGIMVHKRVVVTDEDVAEYLENAGQSAFMAAPDFADPAMSAPDPAAPAQQEAVRLSIIVTASRADAEQLRREVASGAREFAQAAREFSQGPAATEGGSLGEMALADLGGPIRNAVRATDAGEISEVFDLAGQYAFVRVEGVERSAAPAAAEAPAETPDAPAAEPATLAGYSESEQEAVRERLKQQKIEERFSSYMQKLREKAVLRINL